MLWLAALLLPTAARPAEPQDSYESYHASTFLRFLDPGRDGRIEAIPHLMMSLGGAARGAVMDTGSTGIVVSADAIPNIDALPTQGPARLTYSSSGRIMIGRWVVTPVTIAGADGTAITTTPIPVIAVTRILCQQAARNCTPAERPHGVAMIGVGFAREYDHQPQGTPDKNPFLNLATPAGDIRRGYVVTSTGVHVGLTAETTAGAFGFVKLERDPRRPDWAPAPSCVTIAAAPPACGNVLVDTGVGGMFLTVPPDRLIQGDLPPGTPIAITLAPGLGYSFAIGDAADPIAPGGVTLSGIGIRANFVNTSFHVLNGFDYLFDADGGWVGYRARGG